MARHHRLDEKIRIVAEALCGQWQVKDVARRHGINESTLHRWKAEFPRALEAYALLRAGRRLEYIAFLAQESTGSPEASVGAEGERHEGDALQDLSDEFLAWEAQEQERSGPVHQWRQQVEVPLIHWMPAVRWNSRLVAKVHGNLPREDDVLLQIALPKPLHDRLTKQKEGSLNRVIAGLVGYALETLDEEGATLHIYDRRKARPVIEEPRVKYIKGFEAKAKFKARRGAGNGAR